MRVLHFVTGGFSGATQVAIGLCQQSKKYEDIEALLVLRKKRSTQVDRVQKLRQNGLLVEVIPGWSHLATIISIWWLCKKWRPDVFVAHGFSEHLWGRYAALLAGVPTIIHVEHNSRERYTPWRLLQAKWLAKKTDAIIGVSDGVLTSLLSLGFQPEICSSISNGIDLTKFESLTSPNWENRAPCLIMAARLGKQKDHKTLIDALHILANEGIKPRLYLAGTGKTRDILNLKKLIKLYGLENQVLLLGQTENLPALLMENKFFVLSTHYEGMPLALIEAMAAGCACIATNVIGVREVIDHQKSGILVPENNSAALAAAINSLLKDDLHSRSLGTAAREVAFSKFSIDQTHRKYHQLILNAFAKKNG